MIKELFISKLEKISKDFGLNLLASLITTGTAQLILYPVLARLMSENHYGEMLTLMGIANTIAVACGGSLNNVRLLLQEEYDEGHQIGDFNIVLWLIVVISTIVLLIVFWFIYKQPLVISVFTMAFAILCFLRTYISVEYRIILDYKKVLYSNIWVAIGNVIGVALYALVKIENLWAIPFFMGEIFSYIYILKTTSIIREPIRRTELFGRIAGKEAVLLVSALSANVLTYLDRLLLLPLLGGAAVSCYTVASVFGKSLGILMMPLAGVMLSYYAHKGFKMSRSLFWKINLGSICVGVLFSIISLLIAPIFTKILYSSLYNNAKDYLIIANITAIVNVVANMTQPSVLKFAPTFWQLIIQVIYCTIYLVGGVLCVQLLGLWGFSIMALSAAIIKVVMLFMIGNIFIGRKDVDTE